MGVVIVAIVVGIIILIMFLLKGYLRIWCCPDKREKLNLDGVSNNPHIFPNHDYQLPSYLNSTEKAEI